MTTKPKRKFVDSQPVKLDNVLPTSEVCNTAITELLQAVHTYTDIIHTMYMYVKELEKEAGLDVPKEWIDAVHLISSPKGKRFYNAMLALSQEQPYLGKGALKKSPWHPQNLFEEAALTEKYLRNTAE